MGARILFGLLVAIALAGCAGGGERSDSAHRTLACRASTGSGMLAGAPASTRSQAVTPTSAAVGLIRINQVGYGVRCVKYAYLMTARSFSGAFGVRPVGGGAPVLRAQVGPPVGVISPRWPFVYRLDLSPVVRAGHYVLTAGDLHSPPITVGDSRDLYRPLAGAAVSFFAQQRDGRAVTAGPLGRRPAHLLDAHAVVYRTPEFRGLRLVGKLVPTPTRVDASGGWADAGDYLKFTETASFSEVMLLLTLRDYPGALPSVRALRGEARFGAHWLLSMWDPNRRVLYEQVGLGDGNGAGILGDHDLWRLPQDDDRRRGGPGSADYYVGHRPVFAANLPGQPISPNLAGRTAAALGLCAQVFAPSDPILAHRCLVAGQQLFAAADQRPRTLATTQPVNYYGEREWRDDLELGAIELYLGTQRVGGRGLVTPNAYAYLPIATRWADAYGSSDSNGMDSLNLYDVSSLAHYDLIRTLRRRPAEVYSRLGGGQLPTDPETLLRDLRDTLSLAQRLSARDAFGLANPAMPVDTVPHALGYAIEARLYDRLTRGTAYEALAQNEIGWVLGANPWGSSFVVGAGSVYPHCLAHQVANLSGSLTGTGVVLSGATVDGPNALDSLTGLGAPDGYRPCPTSGIDRFSLFDGRRSAYIDDVRSPSTSEPSIDYAALTLMAFAQQAEG